MCLIFGQRISQATAESYATNRTCPANLEEYSGGRRQLRSSRFGRRRRKTEKPLHRKHNLWSRMSQEAQWALNETKRDMGIEDESDEDEGNDNDARALENTQADDKIKTKKSARVRIVSPQISPSSSPPSSPVDSHSHRRKSARLKISPTISDRSRYTNSIIRGRVTPKATVSMSNTPYRKTPTNWGHGNNMADLDVKIQNVNIYQENQNSDIKTRASIGNELDPVAFERESYHENIDIDLLDPSSEEYKRATQTSNTLIHNHFNKKSHKHTKLPTIPGDVRYIHSAKSNGTTFLMSRNSARIPGIGAYTVPLYTSREKTFEITPAGYDSRYEYTHRYNPEEDDPIDPVQASKSYKKCTDWLTRYSGDDNGINTGRNTSAVQQMSQSSHF